MQVVKITGTNYVRDIASMAIMPIDNTEKNDYYAKLRVIRTQKEEINKVKAEMDTIKFDIGEIKNLLQQLLSKG